MRRTESTRLRRLLAGILVVWLGIACGALSAELSKPAPAQPTELKGRQGDVVPVTLTLPFSGAVPVGRLANRSIPFFPLDDGGRFGALVGIDLDAPVGPQPLTVLVNDRPVAEWVVVVERQEFPVQTLTLPDEMVHLDEPTLARVTQEQQEVEVAMAAQTRQRWWSGAFMAPAEGAVMGSFGRRRIINGEPRNPHTGEDISAPEGATVVASNRGVVRLVADHFFSGHSVFIDHGGGLYTMYFHLSKTLVAPAQRVEKGDLIGYVGSSGRATGPHLHWGARLHGARVNPFQLIQMSFP